MNYQSFLASLNTYARQPLPGSPPEIMPWDATDPWAWEGAARHTLGLILAGETPGPRLFAAADYLLTFPSVTWRSSPSEEALLNATALALCGYLCDGGHPEAGVWRLTGCARLANEAHLRRAALEDRMLADCLLAVCRVADECELPILADLVTLRERMWGRLLDHSRVERLHVPEDEYPQHMIAPVPVAEVGALMRARQWQARTRSPGEMLTADLEDAEGTCRNLITLRAHMLVRHQFGSDVDWHIQFFEDKESTVSLNFQPFLRNLAAAYLETGAPRYAEHAARLMWSWYRQCPVPNHRQYTGPWRTLEVGGRPWRVWLDVISHLGQTAPFDAATHSMLARSRLEHMRYLIAFCGGPNNWYQVEASGLAVAALCSPELKLADAYLRIALRRLKWINSVAYYDDGFQFELSHGYHAFPTMAITSVVRAAQARSVTLPGDFVQCVEKAHEMYLYAAQPDHILPMFNDCGPQPTDPAPFLRGAAEMFLRDDFQWGGTHGREGNAPDHTSHAWHSAGYYVMRNKWGEDGQFLFFDGAPWGASHQHEDKLNFTLYAGGRLLIGDPNIYSYSPTELTHYFKASRSHNVVMVDGRGQARRFRPEARLSTPGRTEWVTLPGFDFVSSEYLEGFAPDPFPNRGEGSEVDTSIAHRRAIFYVKPAGVHSHASGQGDREGTPLPGYWVLCDLVSGQDADAHKLEQLFHLAPIEQPNAAEPLRPGEASVFAAAIVTQEAGLSNLAILPVDPEGLAARAQKGETSPAVGWYGVYGEFPAWDVTLERRTALPARMDVVLFPLMPGENAFPTITRLHTDAQVTSFRIEGAGIDDTFILCEEGTGPVEVNGITFEGRALLVRRQQAVQVMAVAPVRIVVDGKEFSCENR
jgi:hypothetical protein